MVMFRRSFCDTWRRCSGSGRPELTEHPGAEHNTESWQGEVDVGVRVCLKMCHQFGLEVTDLVVQLDDDANRGPGAHRMQR